MPLEMTITPLKTAGGCIFNAFLHDITERKKAEDEIRAKTRELEDFNEAATGREIRMIELKKEINRLSVELGRKVPYDSP